MNKKSVNLLFYYFKNNPFKFIKAKKSIKKFFLAPYTV